MYGQEFPKVKVFIWGSFLSSKKRFSQKKKLKELKSLVRSEALPFGHFPIVFGLVCSVLGKHTKKDSSFILFSNKKDSLSTKL